MAYVPGTEDDELERTADTGMQLEEQEYAAPTTTGQSVNLAQSPAIQQRKPRTRQSARRQRGSGRFKNVQKYIEANKPALQQLGQKLTQRATTEAGQIGEQVQQRKQRLEKNIQQAAQQQQKETEKAKQYISGVAQTGQLDQQDAFGQEQVREMLSGQRRYDVKNNFETADVSRQAQELEQAYDPKDKTRGVSRLLERTFEPEVDEYTAGERALDTALLSGDPSQIQNIFQTGREAATSAQQQVEQARRQALESIAQRRLESQEVSGQLYDFGEEAQAGIRGEVEDEMADILAEREAYERFLQTGEGADQFISDEDITQFRDLRESAGQKLQDLGRRAQEMMGIENIINIDQDDMEAIRERAQQDILTQQIQDIAGITEPGYLMATDERTGQKYFDPEFAAQQAIRLGELEDVTTEDILQQAEQRMGELGEEGLRREYGRDVIRAEQLPQLLNEIGRVTDNISTEELRTLGMTRSQLTDTITKNVIEGGGAAARANLTELERRLIGLGEQAILDDDEAYRQALLETFAPQRKQQGDVVGNISKDFSEIFDMPTREEITEATVADEKQRARMGALINLLGRGQAFDTLGADMERINRGDVYEAFDPILATKRTAGMDVLSDQELKARNRALRKMAGGWRYQL